MVLESLVSALAQYKIKTREELFHQFQEIFELTESVKPRYAILIDSFYKIFSQAQDQSVEKIISNIHQIRRDYEKEMKDLIHAAEKIDAHHKTILIYDHSHSVQNALSHLQEKGQRFSVLLAEQDMEKTEDNVAFLHSSNIPFRVVPAYMISHLEKSIDMAFFGAVTFQKGNVFVMDPGSKSVISHLKIEHKPTYLFLTTSKFSLWPVKDFKKEIHTQSDKRSHHSLKEIEFQRVKFSHDRVEADLIDFVVTEKGIFDADEIKKEFGRLMKKREDERSKLKLK